MSTLANKIADARDTLADLADEVLDHDHEAAQMLVSIEREFGALVERFRQRHERQARAA